MGMGGQRPTPMKETRCPLYKEAGWVPGPVCSGAENLAFTGIRSSDSPARSQSMFKYAEVNWC